MRLTAHLEPAYVLTGLQATDRAGVVRELASHLAERVDVALSRETVEEEILRRERAHTTCMGDEVAVPHATLEGLDEPLLMIARSETPIPYGPAGEEPVRFFFVLLSPPEKKREHIKLLARICRFVRLRGFLDDLREAADAEGIVEVVRRADREHV